MSSTFDKALGESLYEEISVSTNFSKTLSAIQRSPVTAISEFVDNSRDAGATQIKIELVKSRENVDDFDDSRPYQKFLAKYAKHNILVIDDDGEGIQNPSFLVTLGDSKLNNGSMKKYIHPSKKGFQKKTSNIIGTYGVGFKSSAGLVGKHHLVITSGKTNLENELEWTEYGSNAPITLHNQKRRFQLISIVDKVKDDGRRRLAALAANILVETPEVEPGKGVKDESVEERKETLRKSKPKILNLGEGCEEFADRFQRWGVIKKTDEFKEFITLAIQSFLWNKDPYATHGTVVFCFNLHKNESELKLSTDLNRASRGPQYTDYLNHDIINIVSSFRSDNEQMAISIDASARRTLAHLTSSQRFKREKNTRIFLQGVPITPVFARDIFDNSFIVPYEYNPGLENKNKIPEFVQHGAQKASANYEIGEVKDKRYCAMQFYWKNRLIQTVPLSESTASYCVKLPNGNVKKRYFGANVEVWGILSPNQDKTSFLDQQKIFEKAKNSVKKRIKDFKDDMERYERSLPDRHENFLKEYKFFGCEDGENVVICCHKCRKPRRVNLTQCDRFYNDGMIDKKYLPEPLNSYFELEKIEGVYYPQKNLQNFTCELYMKLLPENYFFPDLNPCDYYAEKIDDAFVCDLKYSYGIITSSEKVKQRRGVNYNWLKENFQRFINIQDLLKKHASKVLEVEKQMHEEKDARWELDHKNEMEKMRAQLREELEKERKDKEKERQEREKEMTKKSREANRQKWKNKHVDEMINLDSEDDDDAYIKRKDISPRVKIEAIERNIQEVEMDVDKSLDKAISIPIDEEPHSNFASPDDGSAEKMNDRESLDGIDVSDDENQQEETYGFDIGKPNAIYAIVRVKGKPDSPVPVPMKNIRKLYYAYHTLTFKTEGDFDKDTNKNREIIHSINYDDDNEQSSRHLSSFNIGTQRKSFILLKDVVNNTEFQQQVTFELKEYESKLPASEFIAHPQIIDFVFWFDREFPEALDRDSIKITEATFKKKFLNSIKNIKNYSEAAQLEDLVTVCRESHNDTQNSSTRRLAHCAQDKVTDTVAEALKSSGRELRQQPKRRRTNVFDSSPEREEPEPFVTDEAEIILDTESDEIPRKSTRSRNKSGRKPTNIYKDQEIIAQSSFSKRKKSGMIENALKTQIDTFLEKIFRSKEGNTEQVKQYLEDKIEEFNDKYA